MNFPAKAALLLTLILTLACTQGCVSVSYNGISYAPTENVEIVKNQKAIPAGYELMGKAVASAPAEEGTRQDLEKKIVKKAMSEGADAVMIVLYEQVKVGEEREDQFLNGSHDNAGWGMDVDTEGNTNEIDYSNTKIDRGASLQTPIFKSIMKAVFLKRKKAEAGQ